MSVILVVADVPRTSTEIAERVGRRLGYRVLGPEALEGIAQRRGVSVDLLQRALDPKPKLLGSSPAARARHLAVIREEVISQILEAPVVCHGLGAHLYVHGVSHVLKVRVLHNPAALVTELAELERVSTERMAKLLTRRAADRRRWSLDMFGSDELDPSMYDLSIKLSQLGPDGTVDLIAQAANDAGFRPMSYSLKVLHDLWTEARARSLVVARYPDAGVALGDGVLTVTTCATERELSNRVAEIRTMLRAVPEIADVEVKASIDFIREAAESLR